MFQTVTSTSTPTKNTLEAPPVRREPAVDILSKAEAFNRPDAIVDVKGYGRQFFVLRQQPYYISTGDNSGYRNTVFPFCGYMHNPGWLIKPKTSSREEILTIFLNCKSEKQLALLRRDFLKIKILAITIRDVIPYFFKDTPLGEVLEKIFESKQPLSSEEKDLFFNSKHIFQEKLVQEFSSAFGGKIPAIMGLDEKGKELLGRFGNLENLIVSYLIGDGFWQNTDPKFHKSIVQIVQVIEEDYKELKDKKLAELEGSGLAARFAHLKEERTAHDLKKKNPPRFSFFPSGGTEDRYKSVTRLSDIRLVNSFLRSHQCEVGCEG